MRYYREFLGRISMTRTMKSKNTDPIDHLRNLPEYPEGTRVAEKDSRFWAAMHPSGDICVFIDCEHTVPNSDLGEILPSILLHADQLRVSRSVFSLTEGTLTEKFLTVFVAIANEANAISDSKVCTHIKHEILEWSAFLSPRRIGISDEKLRGLWGELFILNRFIGGRFTPWETLQAYVGIHAAPQDLTGHNFSIEVKTTISRAPSAVSISSLEQLDANCPSQLLILITLIGKDDGQSISDLIERILFFLETDVSAAMQFRKLVYDALEDATEAQLGEKFEPANITAWDVKPDFPALRRSNVPDAVQRVEYSIALHQISNFLLTEDVGDWIDGIRIN
jgi:hypothetical protein